MKKIEERVKMVKAMEFIVRQVNDETIFDSWLMNGVADGDIEYGNLDDIPGEAEYYAEDNETFAELMALFLRIMKRANKDGLYCGGVVSN